MKMQKWIASALAVASVVMVSGQAHAGVITIIDRESKGSMYLFAGSGGAVDQLDNDDAKTDLTGAFSFSDLGFVFVQENMPFSTGTADAAGSISVTDNVVQPGPSALTLTATRTASGNATSTSGPSNGISTLDQTFRVRFTTGADPVDYLLTGDFDPGIKTGAIGDTGQVSLKRPFTANTAFNITAALAGINQAGTLPANQTWEFLISMNDKTTASLGDPSNSDASSLGVTLTLTTIPEPASAAIFTGASLLMLNRKPRRPIK